jgi:hypothetical protein
MGGGACLPETGNLVWFAGSTKSICRLSHLDRRGPPQYGRSSFAAMSICSFAEHKRQHRRWCASSGNVLSRSRNKQTNVRTSLGRYASNHSIQMMHGVQCHWTLNHAKHGPGMADAGHMTVELLVAHHNSFKIFDRDCWESVRKTFGAVHPELKELLRLPHNGNQESVQRED